MEGSWGRRGDEGAPATTPYALTPKRQLPALRRAEGLGLGG